MNSTNDTKTPELEKSAQETENICDSLWHLSELGLEENFQMTQLALKHTKISQE